MNLASGRLSPEAIIKNIRDPQVPKPSDEDRSSEEDDEATVIYQQNLNNQGMLFIEEEGEVLEIEEFSKI